MQETHGVAVDQLEPDEIAQEGNDDTLVKDREDRSQGKAEDHGILQNHAHKEQQRCRKEDLVEEGLQGHGPVGQVFLYIDGGRPPECAGGQGHQIARQGAGGKRTQVPHEQGHHTGKRQDETCPFPGAEPISLKKNMGLQGHEEGGGVPEDVSSGGQGVAETQIDEAKFATKKKSDHDSVKKDPLRGKKGNSLGLHPDVKAHTGHQGPEAGHEQGCQFTGPDLDDGHVGPPDQGQDQEGSYRLPAQLGFVHSSILPQMIRRRFFANAE